MAGDPLAAREQKFVETQEKKAQELKLGEIRAKEGKEEKTHADGAGKGGEKSPDETKADGKRAGDEKTKAGGSKTEVKKDGEKKAEDAGKKAGEKKPEEKKGGEGEGKKADEKKDEGKKEGKAPEKKREVILERIYTVPMKDAYAKPQMLRANAAVKILRGFLQRHMKAEGSKVKVSISVNNIIRKRGGGGPLKKIKIKATKDKEGGVLAELAA